MAILSTAAAHARAWGECVLNLAFPWPESSEAAPVTVEAPYCERCGYPYVRESGYWLVPVWIIGFGVSSASGGIDFPTGGER